MSVIGNRRRNLEALLKGHGSQADLAAKLAPIKLTQPIISNILRKKRSVKRPEARGIERLLIIPDGWLDKAWTPTTRILIRQFQRLPQDSQAYVNRMLEFDRE